MKVFLSTRCGRPCNARSDEGRHTLWPLMLCGVLKGTNGTGGLPLLEAELALAVLLGVKPVGAKHGPQGTSGLHMVKGTQGLS